MGLDISVHTNNMGDILSKDYFENHDFYSSQFNLSRSFLNFLSRRDVMSQKPELDQIGEIVDLDITPIYNMLEYPSEEGVSFLLDMADTELEKEKILMEVKIQKEKLASNIHQIIKLINELIVKLSKIDNLPNLLLSTDYDTLDNEYYFSDFNTYQPGSWIENKFGNDLRNLQNFLKYALQKESTTVWFELM